MDVKEMRKNEELPFFVFLEKLKETGVILMEKVVKTSIQLQWSKKVCCICHHHCLITKDLQNLRQCMSIFRDLCFIEGSCSMSRRIESGKSTCVCSSSIGIGADALGKAEGFFSNPVERRSLKVL